MLTHREKSLVENFIELLTPNKVIHNIEDMVEKDNKDFKLKFIEHHDRLIEDSPDRVLNPNEYEN